MALSTMLSTRNITLGMGVVGMSWVAYNYWTRDAYMEKFNVSTVYCLALVLNCAEISPSVSVPHCSRLNLGE